MVTWGNAGPHSAEPSIPDKDEVPGSSPGRPTTQPSRSERRGLGTGGALRVPGPHMVHVLVVPCPQTTSRLDDLVPFDGGRFRASPGHRGPRTHPCVPVFGMRYNRVV